MAIERRSKWKLYDIQSPISPQQIENINSNFDRLFSDLFTSDISKAFVGEVWAAEYGGTGITPPFVVGDILMAHTPTTWNRFAAGPVDYVLKSQGAGALPVWGQLTHELLSSTLHTDTLTGTVVRGDVIVGNATPKWSRLARGTTGYFLRAGAADVGWSNDGGLLTNIPEAALTDDAILARIAANESISGQWTFTNITKFQHASFGTATFLYGASTLLRLEGTAADWVLDLINSKAAGNNYGMRLTGGASASDYNVLGQDRLLAPLWWVKGDGTAWFKGPMTVAGGITGVVVGASGNLGARIQVRL